MRKMMTEKVYIRLLFAAALIAVLALSFGRSGRLSASAEDADGDTDVTEEADPTPTSTLDYVNAEEYLTGYFAGVITKDDSNVYEGPGTKAYSKVTTSAGTSVTLSKGTEVTIIGESRDADLDHWYHVTLEFEGETVSGYVWDGRVERQAQVTFTPTPTVTPVPTDTPTPTPEVAEDTGDAATTDEETEKMTEQSKDPSIWIWLLIVVLIILVIIVIYAVLSKREEDRLEEEMKRYTNNNSMERLDGEDEEDWASAVKEHRKHQLVGRGELPEEDDDYSEEEDLTVDMTGIFSDDENTASEEPEENPDYTEEVLVQEIRDRLREEEQTDSVDTAITAATDDWNEEDEAYVNSLTEGMSEEDRALFGKLGNTLTEEAGLSAEELLRGRLDQLKEQDLVVHKLYGEGEVIDNSDAEVIQIRFGNDLRFLKKEKLAKKDLIVF